MTEHWTLKIYEDKILQTKLTLIYVIGQEQNTEIITDNDPIDLSFFITLAHSEFLLHNYFQLSEFQYLEISRLYTQPFIDQITFNSLPFQNFLCTSFIDFKSLYFLFLFDQFCISNFCQYFPSRFLH